MRNGVVYYCYDVEGRLLYVGTTIHTVRQRLMEHRSKKPRPSWVDSVDHVRSVQYETWQQACAAEKVAIRELRPLFNKLGNPDWFKDGLGGRFFHRSTLELIKRQAS